MAYRIGIMGAGAIGSVVGGMLTKAGHDVTMIDQWPAHVEAMRTTGLQLSGTCGEHTVKMNALNLFEAQLISEPFDAAFLSVKGYDTEWATMFIMRFLKEPEGVIVDFQNGINDHRVAAVAGAHRTLGCVITIGAGMYEPGKAMRTDTNEVGFKIGELDGKETARAQKLADVMCDVATTKVTPNLFGERWSKLAVNCMANPVAGLSGLGSSEVRTDPIARKIAIRIADEVIRVGRAAGYEVEPLFGIPAQKFVDAVASEDTAALETEMGARATGLAIGRPSFLQDVMRGRRTEIQELNGLVVSEGRRLGVATPFNEAIVHEVVNFPVGKITPNPKNLEPLARMIKQAIPAT
ncbi:MAG: 2-dehydropantoate 2-reductase [Chloroflexota bacterium]